MFRADAVRTLPKGVRIGAWCAAALFALASIGVIAVALGCPPVEALHDHRPPQASLVFDKDGKLLARLAPEERIVVPLSAMAPKLVGAFLAVEDTLLRAQWHRLAPVAGDLARPAGLSPGGPAPSPCSWPATSSPTFTRARTLRRKLAEMIVARRIERAFMQQIPGMYLNQTAWRTAITGRGRGPRFRPTRDGPLAGAGRRARRPPQGAHQL